MKTKLITACAALVHDIGILSAERIVFAKCGEKDGFVIQMKIPKGNKIQEAEYLFQIIHQTNLKMCL